MNKVDGFCLSNSWKFLICSLKNQRNPFSQDSIARFSTGSRTSMHTVLNRAPTLASLGTHQPWAFPSSSNLHALFFFILLPHRIPTTHKCHPSQPPWFSFHHTHLKLLTSALTAA
jgi:hypothetical protein